MWKLIILDDQHQKTVVNLVRDQYTIGRSEGHAVRLTERNISRRHATISRTTSGFRIEDHGSYNGTSVNGVRLVGRQDLAHGDLIQLGDYRIHVMDEAIETQEQGYRPYMGATLSPSSGRLPHRLVELIGPDQGKEFPLEGERFLVGRGPECEFHIDHGSVSRVHAEVRTIGSERFEILDKGSANGLRINGHDRSRAILDGRDVIEIGDVVLKYIPEGQVFSASPSEGARIAALAGTSPPPSEPASKAALLPSLLAATGGAALMAILGMLFLNDGHEREAKRAEPSLEAAAISTTLNKAAQHIGAGELAQAARLLDDAPRSERARLSYAMLERRLAEKVLSADSIALPEETHRELLHRISRLPGLPAELRDQALEQLKMARGAPAIDLSTLEAEDSSP